VQSLSQARFPPVLTGHPSLSPELNQHLLSLTVAIHVGVPMCRANL